MKDMFEYKIVELYVSHILESYLNKYGKQGWKLIKLERLTPGSKVSLIFIRKIKE